MMFDKKAALRAFLVGIVFALGFFASSIYAALEGQNSLEHASSLGVQPKAVATPRDRVSESQIGVYSRQVILDIKDAQWATFTDTHSMEPVLSSTSNAIEVVPKSADEIEVGDIVSYKSDYADGIIIHRVIEKSVDGDGVYFILKGDNNPEPDPGRIRFSQVQRVVVAIIY